MDRAAILAEIKRMLEEKMPRTIMKAGTIQDIYLLVSGGVPYSATMTPRFRHSRKPHKAKRKVVPDSKWIYRRFGIKV